MLNEPAYKEVLDPNLDKEYFEPDQKGAFRVIYCLTRTLKRSV